MTASSFWIDAVRDPGRIALIEPDGRPRSAGDLLASGNRLVHGLRAEGLATGDCIALSMANGGLVLELYLAAMQAGWQIAPINPHLAVEEVAYILRDSGAKAFFADSRITGRSEAILRASDVDPSSCFAAGGAPGFRPIASLTEGRSDALPDRRIAGQMLQYTSGTTGRPKAVRRALPPMDPDTAIGLFAAHLARFDITPGGDGVHLCGSPMYHLAALAYAWFSLHFGHRVVLMDEWDSERALALVEAHRVTQTHMVPTQFHRLLRLPPETRQRYDVSSLRNVLHAAAPCPIETKRQMLAWWGPVLYEYYGSSEGGGTLVTAAEWLQRPGTVGRAWAGAEIRILDDDGRALAPREPGAVYMKLLQDFEYGGDLEKTRRNRRGSFFTVGDVGYLDEDGYLFLCDRQIDMIISGGVNIYPAEVEAALLAHPRVADAAVFGIPDPEWGESVKGAVELVVGVTPSADLADAIIAHCRERLAHYKCPRTIDFHDALPRDPNGKLYKRRLRDPWWQGTSRSI